jgi:hypothetical protein
MRSRSPLPSFPSACKYEYPLLALADTLSGNRALAKLDTSNNYIEQVEPLQLITELEVYSEDESDSYHSPATPPSVDWSDYDYDSDYGDNQGWY